MQEAVIAFDEKFLRFDGKKFYTIDPTAAKKYRVGCHVPSNFVRSLSFKLPRNLSPEQLAVQVELKMYNEGGLDPNKEYAIDFISYDLEQENSYLVEAFALEKEEFDAYIGDRFKKIGFIDVVYPKFITYKALYDAQAQTNDLILHFGTQEAFGVFFKEGKFIGYRTIDTLPAIAKKVGIELVKLKTMLYAKGIVASNYLPEEMHIFDALQEAIYKNVEKIVYAVNFKRSYFGFDCIDRLVIDFEGQEIPGLRELFLSFGIEGDFRVEKISCCDMDAKEVSLAIEALYVAQFDELDQKLNFTFYERKKPLYQYEVVRYAAVLLLFMALLGGGYSYVAYKQDTLDASIAAKEQQLARLKSESKRYLAMIKKLKDEKAALQKSKTLIQNELELYQDTLDTIPFIQEAKLQREQMINDIVEALYHFRLSTKAIEQNGTKFAYVELLSQDMQREKIAKFIRYLLDKRYKNVQTKEIERKDGLYQSRVKVAR